MVKRTNRGQEARRGIFRIESGFHRPTINTQLFLPHWQSRPARHTQLPFDKVNARDFFSHRVFDLQPRIHFHEPDTIGAETLRRICNEFDCASTDIVDGFCRFHRHRAKLHTGRFVHARRGGFFNYLLVTTLQRTIAFEQMNDVAMGVAKHLHLNVARALNIFLDQHMRIAE